MCGVLGIVSYGDKPLSKLKTIWFKKIISNLLIEGQRRGSDASGLCLFTDKKARVFRKNVRSTQLVKLDQYKELLESVIKKKSKVRTIFGHTRAKTKGPANFHYNNHPIVAGNVIGVHNGMISNDNAIFESFKLDRSGGPDPKEGVDSEAIFRLVDHFMGKHNNIISRAVIETSRELVGTYACAFVSLKAPNYLTLVNSSKAGNLHLYVYESLDTMIFASEASMIEKSVSGDERLTMFQASTATAKRFVIKSCAMRINLLNGKIYQFDLADDNSRQQICGTENLLEQRFQTPL